MRIQELTIENVRGIRSRYVLDTRGQTTVLVGPNGVGKSSIIDAIDFLLSGNIGRLRGEGTAGITLDRHGPHLAATPETARVSAVVKLDGEHPFTIARSFAAPRRMECPEAFRDRLEPIEALARNRHHILTRADILRLIVAGSGDRREQLWKLLRIEHLEELREALLASRRQLRGAAGNAAQEAAAQQGRLNEAAGLGARDAGELTARITALRAELGAAPLDPAATDGILAGIPDRPEGALPGGGDVREELGVALASAREAFASTGALIATSLDVLRGHPELQRMLFIRGIAAHASLLPEDDGRCPLCDSVLEPGALVRHLERKLAEAREIDAAYEALRGAFAARRAALDALIAPLDRLIPLATAQAWALLKGWRAGLALQRQQMERFPELPATVAPALNVPDRLDAALASIPEPSADPEGTPWQEAFASLVRIDGQLAILRERQAEEETARAAFARAEQLYDAFMASRDAVLRELYAGIERDVETFYHTLHDHEAGTFRVRIAPTAQGAGVNFEAQFLDGQHHPPRALHSEGHQDSLGLCLFLALARRLAGGDLGILLLDDVVMSVDREHRKAIGRLLGEQFGDYQLFMTTHDATWAEQLRMQKIGRVHRLEGWDFLLGPQDGRSTDIWDLLEEDLRRGDVHVAAGRLRRDCEEFFAKACSALNAPVPFRSHARPTFEQLRSAAMTRLKGYLKDGIAAERAWGNVATVERLERRQEEWGRLDQITQSEQWVLNRSVHFNEDADFTHEEIRDVAAVLRELQALFGCEVCGAVFEIVHLSGNKREQIVCSCTGGWTLTRPPRKK